MSWSSEDIWAWLLLQRAQWAAAGLPERVEDPEALRRIASATRTNVTAAAQIVACSNGLVHVGTRRDTIASDRCDHP